MREIKFRGQRVDNKEWVYGYYCLNPHFNRAEIFSFDNGRGYVYDVIPETVGQYTGLKDKNGNEIYEGDIVKCWDNSAEYASWGFDKVHIGVIEYTPDCYSLKIPGKQTVDTPAYKHWDNPVYLEHWSNAENIEIIGNIHSNPSLLTTHP